MSWIKKNIVFIICVALSLAVVVYGAVCSDRLVDISEKLLSLLNENFSWLYLLALPCLLVFLIWLACSRYGNIRLGPENEKPEHSTLSWFSMLFCAGTGIGLVFWSIAEPLTHYVSPPFGIEPGSQAAAEFSVRTCFLHWGFLPWTCFAVVGLAVAYFQFKKRQNALISNTLAPLLGDIKAKGIIAKVIDIFAVMVTAAGVATSLGLGCMQICGGLNYLYGVPNDRIVWLIVIVVITCVFTLSAISGIGKGIKILSNINAWVAILLLVLAFFVGPTGEMLNNLVNGLGGHLSEFINDSLKMNASDSNWIMNWRVFYWAWWIAWAPFVGMFIARISKGRTVREFVIAVILVPSLLTFLWFAVFGTLAIAASGEWSLDALAKIAASPETAVFFVLEKYPLGRLLSMIVVVLLGLFFITSADSATFSLSMLSSNGEKNPAAYKKIIWAVLEAAMAYVLLCSGGLKPLQTISIVAALPFLIIMILMCGSLIKSFQKEK